MKLILGTNISLLVLHKSQILREFMTAYLVLIISRSSYWQLPPSYISIQEQILYKQDDEIQHILSLLLLETSVLLVCKYPTW